MNRNLNRRIHPIAEADGLSPKNCVNAAINILKLGLSNISAGTVDYTGGEEVRANLLKGRSSAKPEAHEYLAHG